MKKIDAVVFDMDGVIFDSERLVLDCWNFLAKKHSIPNIENTIRACIGTNKTKTKAIMKEIYGDQFPYDEYAKEASTLFHERYDGGRLPMKQGVLELLSFLKENDIKIALATSTRREVAIEELKNAGVLGFFDKVVCGDMVERSKPAPDIFIKACDELGVACENAYVIEDSYNGIIAGHAAGLHLIMVPDLLPPTDEMRAMADVILGNLLDVVDYFC